MQYTNLTVASLTFIYGTSFLCHLLYALLLLFLANLQAGFYVGLFLE